MNHKVRRIGKGAFTLIELLVVIAIIAILAAILFPVFAQAKNSARKTQCVSNLKQINIGFQMYMADFDDVWPLWSAGMGLPGNDVFLVSNMYQGLVQPYIKNGADTVTGALTQIWECPTSKPYFTSLSNTYAYNHWTLGGFSSCARTVGLPAPAICTGRTQAQYAEYASEAYNFPAIATSLADPAKTVALTDGPQLSRPPQYAIAFPTGDPQFIAVWGSHEMGKGAVVGPGGPSTVTSIRQQLISGRKTVVSYCDSHTKIVDTRTLYHQAYSAENGTWRGQRTNNMFWSRDWGP